MSTLDCASVFYFIAGFASIGFGAMEETWENQKQFFLRVSIPLFLIAIVFWAVSRGFGLNLNPGVPIPFQV